MVGAMVPGTLDRRQDHSLWTGRIQGPSIEIVRVRVSVGWAGRAITWALDTASACCDLTCEGHTPLPPPVHQAPKAGELRRGPAKGCAWCSRPHHVAGRAGPGARRSPGRPAPARGAAGRAGLGARPAAAPQDQAVHLADGGEAPGDAARVPAGGDSHPRPPLPQARLRPQAQATAARPSSALRPADITSPDKS
jgi:hypothetical protein